MEHCQLKRVKERTGVVLATYIQHGIIERVHCWLPNSVRPRNVHLFLVDATPGIFTYTNMADSEHVYYVLLLI